MSKYKMCPKCDCTILKYTAISRKDNKTEICSKCGLIEALEQFYGKEKVALWLKQEK